MNVRLALMTVLASGIAITMAAMGLATWLEAASFVSGALCVWLTVKESVWNFPIGLINVTTFGVVFFKSRLFADASLQVVYFILGVIGWWMWLYGGEHHSRLTVGRASKRELITTIICVAIGTIAIWKLLQPVSGSAPFWDALTTSISLGSQWLLNRKRLENWIGWIIVDAIYVPLYIYKELYLTAILYAVFFVMATSGLKVWTQKWLEQRLLAGMGARRA
jgi:nicotinamide mononucleotide transporter